MVLSLQTCWNISSFKYTGRNDTKFSEGIYMVNYDKNSRVSHFIIWIRARNNSAIPIMPVLDPDLASETKPISQYENFNYGGWVQFKSFFLYFLFILARVDKVQRKIPCYREDLWLIWAGMGLQSTINWVYNRHYRFWVHKRPVKVPLETNSHCITCPTITERISERSNFDLLIDAESLPNENPLNDNLDSDTGFSKFQKLSVRTQGLS